MRPVPAKREPGESSTRPRRQRPESSDGGGDSSEGEATERRVLRSRYLAVKSLILDERDDLSKVDSEKFGTIIQEVETLHEHVRNPREQVADAEALLDITSTLVASVKSQTNNGVTPSDFVTMLLNNFGQNGGANGDTAVNRFSWSDVGLVVSQIFKEAHPCRTMIGPMDTEMKQRKAVVHKKRTRPNESARPEELENQLEVKTDTDKNMLTMFDLLRKNKRVRLENLVLNRASFAQSVENIFALSFLVKDGRAQISVNGSGHHLVSPRNAPAAASVASGNVSYNHFVFRFDFKDWKEEDCVLSSVSAVSDPVIPVLSLKLMAKTVQPGEEMMPHRTSSTTSGTSAEEPTNHGNSESGGHSTPIRKLSRNRGLVIQEQNVVDDTPERESLLRPKPKRISGSPRRL